MKFLGIQSAQALNSLLPHFIELKNNNEKLSCNKPDFCNIEFCDSTTGCLGKKSQTDR